MATLVLLDAGKIFDKYLKILYDKSYRKLEIMETNINRLKAVYRKSTATININGEVLIQLLTTYLFLLSIILIILYI